MGFNLTAPQIKDRPIEPSRFFVRATHGKLNFTDSFGLGEPSFIPLRALQFFDAMTMGDTKSTSSPIISIPNRVMGSRITVRNAASRITLRKQAPHTKEQEFDNKIRQQQGRIPE